MSPRKAVVWREVVDQLANALQVAVGLAAESRRNAQTTAVDAVALEDAIRRATSVLRQVQPRQKGQQR